MRHNQVGIGTSMLAATEFSNQPVSASQWLCGLRYRPLVWLTPACALGGGAGLMLGLQLQGMAQSVTQSVARDNIICFWPLLPAFGFAFLAWQWRNSIVGARLALFFVLACLCAVLGARRALPKAGDASFLLSRTANTPVQPTILTLRGTICDFPMRGTLFQDFPLDCETADNHPTRGRIWLRTDAEMALEVGDFIEVRDGALENVPRAGNPAQREGAWRFIGARCWSRAKVKGHQIEVLQRGKRLPLLRFVARLRHKIAAHYEAAFAGNLGARPYPKARAQLLTAMVFGRGGLEETMPRRTEDNYRAAGMTHLLVASGQQVTLLAAILLGAAHALGLRRWWLLLLVLPALVNYALIAGGAASIWRATIGGLCLAWALLWGRDIDGLSLWSLAFMALFFIEPTSLADLSFQLTFAATWGLIALAPSLRRFLANAFGGGAIVDVAALTLGAQVAVLPLMLLQFGNASWAGFGFNLVAVPLAGILVTTGVAGLILPLATSINYPLTAAVDNLAILSTQMPGASVQTPPLKTSVALISWILLLGAAALPILQGDWKEQAQDTWRGLETYCKNRGFQIRPQRVLATLVLLLACWAAQREWSLCHARLRVTMLDIGQGEAIIVQAPSGRTILIDGGSSDQPDIGRSIIVPYLQYIGARRLDAVVFTHADSDHCNGIEQVAREIPIALALDGALAPQTVTATDYQIAKLALKRAKVPIIRARAGQKLDLGSGVLLTVLAPTTPPLRESPENNNAAVLRLDYGKTNFLFTADIQKEAEERLLERGAALRCTILKVAHHGSKSSTTDAFLRRAAPQAAIISCGRYNRFGHPAPPVLKSFARRAIPVFRTDLNGAIEITSDGRACYVQTYR